MADEATLLDVATEAAAAAAAELLARRSAPGDVRSKSTPTDLVSDADLAAEAAIRRVLAERRPNDAVLGEEGGETTAARAGSPAGAHGGLRWVVDPLDGTVNYLYGIPSFAVSVAVEDADGALAGVVLDPSRGELWAATRAGPVTLGGRALAPRERARSLSEAMLATGFAYAAPTRARQAAIVARMLPHVRDIRRFGSAALDLCWTAAGRFDAYFERGVQPWDVAAGGLIAARSGLAVAWLPEGEGDPLGIVVAPPGLIEELRAMALGE